VDHRVLKRRGLRKHFSFSLQRNDGDPSVNVSGMKRVIIIDVTYTQSGTN
jgi:hypothetical protein